jgi:hypothetical protein
MYMELGMCAPVMGDATHETESRRAATDRTTLDNRRYGLLVALLALNTL